MRSSIISTPPASLAAPRRIQIAISVGLSVIAVIALTPLVDFAELGRGLGDARVLPLAAGCILYAAYQWLRALRLDRLSGRARVSPGFTRDISVQGAINAVLPAGLGAGLLVFMMTRRFGGRWESYAGGVLLARILDLAALGVFALVGLAVAAGRIDPVLALVTVVFVLLSVGLFVGVMALPGPSWFAGAPGPLKWRVRVRIILRAMRQVGGRRALADLLLLSIVMWSAHFFAIFALVVGLNIPLGLEGLTLGFTLSFPVNFIPAQPMAKLGTLELAFVIILAPLGLAAAQAATAAMGVRLAILLGLAASVVINGTVAALAALRRS